MCVEGCILEAYDNEQDKALAFLRVCRKLGKEAKRIQKEWEEYPTSGIADGSLGYLMTLANRAQTDWSMAVDYYNGVRAEHEED